jgi:ParB/RepB/Spo0J family partition protein
VEEFRRIRYELVAPPRNPVRTMFDEDAMDELARSIRANGIIEPLVCRPLEDGKVEVVAGHRRYIAAGIIGLLELPCLVRDDVATVDAVQIAENADREEMSAADEGRRYVRLFDELGNDVDKVCELVKRTRARVEGRMLLVQGDPIVLGALERGDISIGVAEELNAFKRPEGRTFHLDFAVRCGATRAQVRDWRVRDNQMADAAAAAPPASSAPAAAATAAPPAAALETPYAALARPWEISSNLEPRECLLCGGTDQEYRMFREFFCAACAQKHLVAMKQQRQG